MQQCPVLPLVQKYEELAKQWLETEEDRVYRRLHGIVTMVAQLTPQSIDGATFQLRCALSEMDVIVAGGDAPQIRLAAERRVVTLLRRSFLGLEERCHDFPSTWKFVVVAGEGHLKRNYLASV